MADSIDSLQKQLDKLKRILRAQQDGIPDRLTVMVTGRAAASPEGVKRAVLDRLAAYGLDDEADAEQAGCVITVTCLPWLDKREVMRDASAVNDLHDTSKTALNSVHISVNGLKANAINDLFSLGMGDSRERGDIL